MTAEPRSRAERIDALLAHLARAGDAATLDDLRRRLDRIPPTQAVVVVGEAKKGKSSLVNALVGRTGVSPVDLHTATATYLWFTHGTDEAAWVQLPAGGTRRVPLEELPRWVTPAGLAANPDAAGADGVPAALPVQVAVSAPLLEHIELIDTPGIGALDAPAPEVTLEAAAQTGAVLFVTDLSAPMSRPECEVLARVLGGGTVGEVIVAANMADKLAPAERDAAVAALRQRLAADLGPGLAGVVIVVVSAARAELARRPGLGPEAQRILRAESGLDELERALRNRVAGRRAEVVQAAQLHLVAATARRLADQARTELTLLGAADPAARATALQDRMRDLGHAADIARTRLGDDLNRLRQAVGLHIDSEVRTLQATAERRIGGGAGLEEVAAWLEGELTGLARTVARLTADGIREAFVATVSPLVDPIGQEGALGGESPAADREALHRVLDEAVVRAGAALPIREGQAPHTTPLSADARATALLSFMGGRSIGGLLASGLGLAAASGLSVGLPLAAGGLTVAMQLRRTRRALQGNDARAWTRDRIGTAQRDLVDATGARVGEAGTVASIAVRELMKARHDGLTTAMRAVRADDAPAAAHQARARLEAAGECARGADQLLASLARPTAPPA